MNKHDEQAQPVKSKVQVGDLAPDFTLLNQSGIPVSLGDFLGKQHIVLYFYPRDNTSVCTEEAWAFRESYGVIKDGAEAQNGACSGSGVAHQQFHKGHQLPFNLLTDEEG